MYADDKFQVVFKKVYDVGVAGVGEVSTEVTNLISECEEIEALRRIVLDMSAPQETNLYTC